MAKINRDFVKVAETKYIQPTKMKAVEIALRMYKDIPCTFSKREKNQISNYYNSENQ